MASAEGDSVYSRLVLPTLSRQPFPCRRFAAGFVVGTNFQRQRENVVIGRENSGVRLGMMTAAFRVGCGKMFHGVSISCIMSLAKFDSRNCRPVPPTSVTSALAANLLSTIQ